MILEEGSILRIKEKESIRDATRKGTVNGIKCSDSWIFRGYYYSPFSSLKPSMKFP